MINFFAPINNLGYGVHSYNFLLALQKLQVDIALFPIRDQVHFRDEQIDRWLDNAKRFNKNSASVMIFHEFEMLKFTGKVRIGFPVFETGIEERYIPHLTSLDYILQTSEFGKKYLNDLGFSNVHIIPEGFDNRQYNSSITSFNDKMDILHSRGVVFSTVGKLEKRKSSLDILRVFTQALDGLSTKCTLIAHIYNPFLENWLDIASSEIMDKLGYSVAQNNSSTIIFEKNNLKIIVIKSQVKDIRDIYSSSHFGIYASKAEGWNLPLIESIASGVPCLTTKNTAMIDYLQNYPEELILPDCGVEVANDKTWFFGNKGNWHVPDLGALKSKLVEVARNPEKYIGLREQCSNSVKEYTWENSAKKFVEFMNNNKIDM